MKTRKILYLTALLALGIMATSFAQMGPGNGSNHPGGMGHGQRGDLLTDDQKQELHELVSSMREEGATREEIKEAVEALFVEWGIEKPERDGTKAHPELTEEQRAALHELVQQMKADDATREEIHTAVAALFADWGIEMPEHFGQKGHSQKGGKGHGSFGDPQLTEGQRGQLRDTVQTLKEAGATREEIKAAIEALYGEWGLEMPERGRGNLLTEEQLEQLHTTIQELKDQGATRSDIKTAVDALFEEWGIERPDFCRRDGHKGKHGKGGKDRMGDLSEEQRATIRELVQSMKEAGATREEIREAVKKQLEEWGVGNDDDEEGAAIRKNDESIKAANAPNPFNPTTTITFSLQQPGQVSVKVYNTQGQLIRTLVDAFANEGSHSVVWNGLNEKGEQVSSGLYFYKVTSANETVTERMMLMK